MDSEKIFKSNLINSIKMNSNNKMDVEDFFKKIEHDKNLSIYRHINISYNAKGNKIPTGEKNDLSITQIKSNRGNVSYNTLSLSVKHIPDLYVIDFDSKDVDHDSLYEKLNNECVAYTETKKGSHYYVYIKNIGEFSNQQKINIDPSIDMDLIKINNIWETKGRIVNGTIKEYDWHDIKKYFDVKKLNFKNSPPSSPPSSPKPILVQHEVNVETEEVNQNFIYDEPVHIPMCNEEQFKKHLNSFKPRFEYNDWLMVGFICYNNFKGSDVGFKYWNQYSKLDEEGYEGKKKLKKKYTTLKNEDSNKISYKQFIRWNLIDYPCKNKYEKWYITDYDSFISNMNMECMFHTKSQDIIIVDNDYYFRAKKASAKDYYSKFTFTTKNKDGDDISINPFDKWISSNIDRRDITDIIFDPSGKECESKYNIWKGYKYQNTGEYNTDNIAPFVNHVRDIICNGDTELCEYVLNWFAQIIQTPHKKTKVGLVWRSEAEGVGKNLILNLIKDIIGSEYYYSTSNLEHLIGNFNADAEAKILINMNECLWGGDKKKEGRLKEFITEDTLTINQKGVKTYNIDNYANVCITTNSDWIIGINKNDRRWQMIECSETKHDSEHYKILANTNIQDLTNFFYSRDLSSFDSTKLIKTALHNDQIELNMDSVEIYWMNIITKNRLLDTWLNKPRSFKKSEVHKHYMESTLFGQHDYKVNNVVFWKKLRKISLSMQFKTNGNMVVIAPAQTLKEEYNKYYNYDKFNLDEDIEFKFHYAEYDDE
tara:strand:+ start:12 stop:2306 length:2295 start_codon:yes stop_codon:yes gene_type:complete